MSDDENVNIRFVIPKELKGENISDDMNMAYQSCVDNELGPEWVREELCSTLRPTKQDVFVFQSFQGDAFLSLQKLKCIRLLGPRCLLTCLMEGIPIPESNSPIFTTAMRSLIVTTTNFSGQEKEDLINKIEFMGALFSAKLVGGTTHLVAKNVLSVKYEKAVEKNLNIMTEEWVNTVWEESCKRSVLATDPEFQKYKCPVFHGLTVTCSNLPRQQKEQIRSLINDNGGTFNGQLECENTKLLIVSSPKGEKYKYAREWNLPCVLPSWVNACVKEGYAVSVEPHCTPNSEPRVKCSTPNADETRPNFSMISSIAPDNATHVNETVADSTISTFLKVPPSHKRTPVKNPGCMGYAEILEKLDLRAAKKAGAFLDGCNVYLSGFNVEQTEKLRRVLNGGGATRFNEISDSVTHVIIGEVVPADVKTLKKISHRPYFLKPDWVIESIKLKCPAPEELFLYSDVLLQPTEPPSPLSKKGLQMLRRPSEKPVPCVGLNAQDVPSTSAANNCLDQTELLAPVDLVDQYLHNSLPENELSSTKNDKTEAMPVEKAEVQEKRTHQTQDTQSEAESSEYTEATIIPVFSDLTFFIIDFESDVQKALLEAIEIRGGRVLEKNSKGIADYAVVPLVSAPFTQTATEVVTYFWVEDCIMQDELVPTMYYHYPISLDDTKRPLHGCVLGISSYTGKERDFIRAVAEMLGAITQEMFARKNNEKKNALASTHLVCSESGSQKYNAAIKWKLPAVNHEWVLACAKEGRHVSEEPYLVGESKLAGPTDQTLITNDRSSRTVDCKPLKMNDSSPSTSKPERTTMKCESSTKIADSRPVNKRVTELKTDSPMGPPPSPAKEQGSSPREKNVTPLKRTHTGFSQESPLNIPKLDCTPVNQGIGWPADPSVPTPKGPYHVSTPDTPYGQVFKPNPSPQTRKNWVKWINKFPDFERENPPTRKRRLSTKEEKAGPSSGVECDGRQAHNVDSAKVNLHGEFSKAAIDEHSSKQSSPLFQSSNDNRLSPLSSCGIDTQLGQLHSIVTSPAESSGSDKMVKRSSSTSSNPSDMVSDPAVVNKENVTKDSQMQVEWIDPGLHEKQESDSQDELNKPFGKFMLSGIIEREHYEAVVQTLQGDVSDKPTFDPTATHLVCTRPVRSEKLLASIASGKWVLHVSYLDDSQKHKIFLKEDEYEWGNPSAVALMRDIKPRTLEYDLALAAYRWRCTLTGDTNGAFMGMSALVCISREREEPFKRLILAGGGRLVDFSNLDDATHCFVEINKATLPVELSVLVKKRIPCVPPLYLNDYLIKNPPPQAHQCVIPEYKQLLNTS